MVDAPVSARSTGSLRHLGVVPSDDTAWSEGAARLARSAAYWLFFAGVTLLLLTPISFLVFGSFQDDATGVGVWTAQNWVRLFGGEMGPTVKNTLVIGFLAAAISTGLGTLLAWLLERTDVAMARLCAALLLASFALPGFILAMAWIIIGSKGGMLNAALKELLGPEFAGFDIYSPQGLLLVLCLHLIPISFLSMRGPIRNLDATLEDAASMCGASRRQVATRIVLPLLRYPVGSSFLLSFVLAVEQFAIPAMIGIPGHFNMLSTELYTLVMFQPPRQGAAAALGLLLAAITSVALFAHYQIARRTSAVTVTGRSFRRTVHTLGWMRMPATVFCFAPVVGAAVIPVLALSYAGFTKYPVSNPFEASYTFRAVTSLFTTGGTVDILWNTVLACVSATLLAMVLGFVIAFEVQRRHRASARFLQSFGAMSFGFPGIVIGLGFLWSYVWLPIYGTLFALILAFAARYLPYAVETTSAALRQLDVGLEEAADMSGASAFDKLKRIVLPLLRPSLQSASLLLFVTFVREISAAALLYTPDTQVLSIAIWTSFEHANWARASILSLVVVAIVLAITALASINEGGRAPSRTARAAANPSHS